MLRFVQSLKPGVHKTWLQICAGSIWLGVGVMLDSFAARWLRPLQPLQQMLLVLAGLCLAAGIYAVGFSRLAKKNIQRIDALKSEKACLFAFQQWSSYPLVLVMVALGIFLRVYSPLPKSWLAILYLGIGSALFAAGLHYFRQLAFHWRGCPVGEGAGR